jgi:glyoxylase-like metal-dependent hydrolase (beta-lactamase superfamily II)
MHPACKGVIENNNRAYGASGRLSELNKYYTRLINKFTDCKFPEDIHFFSTTPIGNEGEFNIIDVFTIGNLTFEVLESHGGHIPGHVFFLNKDSGLVFTSDFLINIRSLSAEEKDILSVYRYLLTNPNSDNQLFKSESDALRDVIMNVENDLKSLGSYATIFPGHGDYYRANSIIEVLTQKRQSN